MRQHHIGRIREAIARKIVGEGLRIEVEPQRVKRFDRVDDHLARASLLVECDIPGLLDQTLSRKLRTASVEVVGEVVAQRRPILAPLGWHRQWCLCRQSRDRRHRRGNHSLKRQEQRDESTDHEHRDRARLDRLDARLVQRAVERTRRRVPPSTQVRDQPDDEDAANRGECLKREQRGVGMQDVDNHDDHDAEHDRRNEADQSRPSIATDRDRRGHRAEHRHHQTRGQLVATDTQQRDPVHDRKRHQSEQPHPVVAHRRPQPEHQDRTTEEERQQAEDVEVRQQIQRTGEPVGQRAVEAERQQHHDDTDDDVGLTIADRPLLVAAQRDPVRGHGDKDQHHEDVAEIRLVYEDLAVPLPDVVPVGDNRRRDQQQPPEEQPRDNRPTRTPRFLRRRAGGVSGCLGDGHCALSSPVCRRRSSLSPAATIRNRITAPRITATTTSHPSG